MRVVRIIDRVVYYNSCLVTSFASTCLCHRDSQSGGRRILFIISADCLDVSLPCRPLPKPNNLYLYLIGHPAHQRSYDLLLHHGFYCSPLLHLSGEAFPASLYCSLPLRHDLCLTSQLSTAPLYYSLTA